MFNNEEITEITQLPVVTKNGQIQIFDLKLSKLSGDMLKAVADTMGGQIVYLKVRATYTELENSLCTYRDCFRPVGQSGGVRCGDHA